MNSPRSLYLTGRPVRLAALIVAVSLTWSGPAQATTELRKEMAEMAGVIKKILDGRDQKEVAVQPFTGPATFPASSGAGISQFLIEELKKLKINVALQSRIGVKGEYVVNHVPADDGSPDKLLAVRVRVKLEDESGSEVSNIERIVKGEDSLLKLLGLSVELSPSEDDPKERNRVIDDVYHNRNRVAHLRGGRVNSGPDGKFGMEILVQGIGRPVEKEAGLGFVHIGRNEKYVVRLYNEADVEMAVQLSIDGLSMFTFCDPQYRSEKGDPRFSVVFVGAHKFQDVPGWFRSPDKADSFVITEYAKSAAAQKNVAAQVGTIVATYAAAWLDDGPRPADEPAKKKGVKGGDATGFGPPVRTDFRVVKRTIGVTRGSVAIRYHK